MPKYIIRAGTLKDSDGTLKGPGDTIELDADMAAHHHERVELAADADTIETQAPAHPADDAAQ